MSPEGRFRGVLLRRHRKHGRSFPWRATRDPYAVLVGEILLQRTRGEHVTAVFETFLSRWPTPEELARARTTSIEAVIRPLGLPQRAPLLKRLGKALAEYGGVPERVEDLLAMPGVGPYAAHSVQVFARGKNLPVVDWVIARVLRRYFGLPLGTRPNADPQLWALAENLSRPGRARDLWLATLDFAASVCKPRPACPTCPLRSDCVFASSSTIEPRALEAVTPSS